MAGFIDRIKVWTETKAVAEELAAAGRVLPSEKLTPDSVPHVAGAAGAPHTALSIDNVDCIEMALTLQTEGLNPVVLNLSDDRDAGGCIDLGSGAQEESIWRRTAVCATQLQSFYPLKCEAIYSPSVLVLRRPEREFYVWYAEAERPRVSFIACPAIKMPQWVASAEEPDGDLGLRDKMELGKRLRLILRVAAAKGHDSVVLGAMGCGAWGNPPRAVARVFAAVLPEFDGVFKKIVIAILSPPGGRSTIMGAFTSVFDAVLG
jgi:uncharacterized protein (TIGR02452 family)